MIKASWPWKQELRRQLRSAARLSDGSIKSADQLAVRTEHFFFWSCFVTRKLDESGRLSDELVQHNYSFARHKRLRPDETLDYLNSDELDRFFDLENEKPCSLSVLALCNCVIHSFIFQPVALEDQQVLTGALVTSDKRKDQYLYYVGLPAFCQVIEDVASDDVRSMVVDMRSRKVPRSRHAELSSSKRD